MNFNAPLLRSVRIVLFPVSLLYAAAIWVRNKFYDWGLLQASSFNLPIITIGNLSVGGTGKSIMIEFLLKKLQDSHKLAVLSRGYKRKTRGYALAGNNTSALEIGDEPMQFHIKFPRVSVAVGEERVVAVAQLLHDRPNTDLILLDDAFQHRSIKAGLNILLTDYNNLFTRDWYLPTGDLRDEKSSYRRADIIVVSKCPGHLSAESCEQLRHELKPLPDQEIFFATLQYGKAYHILHKNEIKLDNRTVALLITGIANPASLKKYLEERIGLYEELLYGDHHIFTIDDWKEIRKRFSLLKGAKKIILTTEKDAVRLVKFGKELEALPVYVIPVEMQFLLNQENRFIDLIVTFIGRYSRGHQQTLRIDEQKKP